MFEFSAGELFEQLCLCKETTQLEAKKGSEIGDSVMQTVNAFANEPNLGGGYILLGVSEPDQNHSNYWVSGITNREKLLSDLQANCRDQFEHPIPIYVEEYSKSIINAQEVLLIYVPELPANQKPCFFKGKFASKNKKKTGAWRRGLNGDYECSQQDLEQLLLAKTGQSFENIMLPTVQWSDLDPKAIERYRILRAKVRPEAEELQANDEEMLFALGLVQKNAQNEYIPNVAGLVLLGKSLSLRRLLPEIRVDYVQMKGITWAQDNILTTLDLREPLIYLIPKLEAQILKDMPRHFRLESDQLQRQDQPLLPQKVVRETIVNAVMHRDYLVKEPVLIVRYDNRIETKNAGYSLKPEEQLGSFGSRLRNPIIASVLYDLNFAETKGSGIGVIRHQLKQANLSLPVFMSNTLANSFTAIYLLHQLFDEHQLRWLAGFNAFQLTDDEAKALVFAKEAGFINNQSLRNISDLDTLNVSQLFAKLTHKYGLLLQNGSGKTTYYVLSDKAEKLEKEVELNENRVELNENRVELNENRVELNENRVELPRELQKKIAELGVKAREHKILPLIVEICMLKETSLTELAGHLNRQEKSLRKHIRKLLDNGYINYKYPEIMSHPVQAYVTTEDGKIWLNLESHL